MNSLFYSILFYSILFYFSGAIVGTCSSIHSRGIIAALTTIAECTSGSTVLRVPWLDLCTHTDIFLEVVTAADTCAQLL